EGIIVLTKAMSYVTKGENFSAPIIGQIISATLIIYFLYMLYFDRVPNPHIRLPSWFHNFWALVHFPFHLALVLFMEGTSRLITWRNALEMFDVIYEGWNDIWLASNDTTVLADGFSQLGDIVLQFSEADLSKFNITGYLTDLTNEADGATEGAAVAAVEILVTLVNALFKFFKIEAAKKEVKKEAASGLKVDPVTSLQNAIEVYDLVFVYFFVAAGLTLVIMALLMVLSKRKKVLGDWLGVALRLALGVGISLVAIVKTNFNAKDNFISSAWMLPCVMLGLLVVVVAEGVLGWVLPAPRQDGGHGEVERGG
ncbi:MAG: hypothetical protein Q9214_007503, partial [Letrouitia sp. 1 TL-2023]